MASESFRSTSFPAASADSFSILSEEEQQADELVDQVLSEKNSIRQEKIERLVSDGARNYPAYLKLIYTGESELSSEDEAIENRIPTRFKTTRTATTGATTTAGSATAQARQRQPFPVASSWGITVTRTSRDSGAVLSPESNKLLDPGREKVTTPSENADHVVSLITPTSDDVKSIGFLSQSSDLTTNQAELELLKIQDDIATLRGVLNAKLQIAADLKRKLGITPFTELKQSVRHFKDTDTYQRTNAVFKHFGVFATKKMANFRQKTSAASKSHEEPDLYSNDLSIQDYDARCKLQSSKSETNVASYSSSNRR